MVRGAFVSDRGRAPLPFEAGHPTGNPARRYIIHHGDSCWRRGCLQRRHVSPPNTCGA